MNLQRLLCAVLLLLVLPSVHGGDPAAMGWIEVDGAIGPSTADYIERAIEVASEGSYQCLVVRLDTPGGLLDSTKKIVQSFFSSPLPIVVYVAPEGSTAGSAGVFITMAADVAVMAPNTTIGAAHPVSMGGGPTGGSSTNQQSGIMEEKMRNYAASYIESIAEKRGRNVEWARSAVEESASITADDALEKNVIDLIARDREELTEKLNGLSPRGTELQTEGAAYEPIPRLLREKFFQLIWRPEVMFILMLVAMYGIIGELTNPGAIIPGVIGGIALILTLYMSSVLPVNAAGVALILLAVGLFVAEVFTPTFGLLTAAGAVSFVFGALMLFDTNVPSFSLSLAWILPATILTILFFVVVIGAGLKAQFRGPRTGRESLVGRNAQTLTAVGPSGGRVWVMGENWNAVSDQEIGPGESVEILSLDGLTLKVKPGKS